MCYMSITFSLSSNLLRKDIENDMMNVSGSRVENVANQDKVEPVFELVAFGLCLHI